MMKLFKEQKGFTLIELLVVIAIIGILASIVLASLNTARNKGSDAAVKADLQGVRSAAEVEYDDASSSYAGVCVDATVLAQINDAILKAGATAVVVDRAAATPSGGATCNDGAGGYAVEVALKSDNTKFWCVDFSGKSQLNAAAGLASATDYGC